MSTHLAFGHPAVNRFRRSASPQRRLSRVSPMARRARRTPFVVILLTVLGFGLIGLILISTAMQTQTFELSRLTNQARDLEIQQQALERTVNDLASPRSLGPRATQLGMVPNETPVYLELADGSVRGKPTPAERQPGFAKAIR